MAVPTNTSLTYTAVGNREDLSDTIYDISPTETPVASRLARVSASNTTHTWQMDSLAAVDVSGAVEGDDHSGLDMSPTLKLSNYTQIFRRDIVVSGTQRAMDPAGRADELDYQTLKRGKEMKRNIEAAFTRNNVASPGGATTGRTFASMETWMGSTSAQGIQYPYVSKDDSTTPAATSPGVATATGFATTAPTDRGAGDDTVVLEADLKSVVKQAWDNGGNPRLVVAGSVNKQNISGFSGIAQIQHNVTGTDAAIITGAADIYKSDFGAHAIVPSRFNRPETILVVDEDMWANAELRPMQTTPIAKTGDSDKVMLLTEITLECRNPFASGKIADTKIT